ncbi:MAG: hypothetical protein AAF570_27360, partial [Bacteroidota bacterium]
QNYTVDIRKIGVEDGLSHRTVSAAIEDEYGFLWLGGPRGLQRFDGVDFKTWTEISPTEKLRNVTELTIDREGWLWIWDNTKRQFSFLHTTTLEMRTAAERFGEDFPIRRNADESGWAGNTVVTGSDSSLRLTWALSKPSRIAYYESGDAITTVPIPDFEAHKLYLDAVDANGNLWIHRNSGSKTYYRISPTGKILAKLSYQEAEKLNLRLQSGHHVHISYQLGQHYFEETMDINATERPLQKKQLEMRPAKVDDYGERGRWHYERNQWRIFKVGSDDPIATIKRTDQTFGMFDMIYGSYQDHRDRIWIFGEWGLHCVIVRPNPFQHLLEVPEGSKLNVATRGIVATEDSIFVNLEFSGLAAIPKDVPKNWSLIDQSLNNQSYNGRPLL